MLDLKWPAMALLACCLAHVPAQAVQPIVGSWVFSDGGSFGSVTFLEDGRYIEASVEAGDAAHTGIEWGAYSWDAGSGAIAAVALGDQNGNWGIAGDEGGAYRFVVHDGVGEFSRPDCTNCVGDGSASV